MSRNGPPLPKAAINSAVAREATPDRAINPAEAVERNTALTGGIDGAFGPRTRKAIGA